jgi:hypothetical protein
MTITAVLLLALLGAWVAITLTQPGTTRRRCRCGRRATQPHTLCRRHRHVVGWTDAGVPLYGVRMVSPVNRPVDPAGRPRA